MSKAIRIHKTGGPEVLTYEDHEPGKPGKGEILIEHKAIGLNFIDVYFRTGLYKAELPLVPGGEASGVVAAVGDDVRGFEKGDRVAYCVRGGAYSQARVIAADRVVKVPDAVSDEQAAAMMLKGMTAWYLLHRTYAVQPGDTILCHAAAGGVGLIVGQWAKHLGATVIGTAGSAEKVGTCQGAWLRSRHQLPQRGFRRQGQGNRRRRQMRGGLRFGRQGHVSRLPRLSSPR